MKKAIHYLYAILILGFLSTQSYALMLSVQPSSRIIDEGDPVLVDIVISGLNSGGPDSLGAFSFDFTFNSDILTYQGAGFGSSLGDPLLESLTFEDNSNAVNGLGSFVYLDQVSLLFDFELDALQSDSFTLATLVFTGNQRGVSLLSLDDIVLSDAFGDELSDLSTSFSSISVPEPSTFALLMIAGAGLAMRGVKRRNH